MPSSVSTVSDRPLSATSATSVAAARVVPICGWPGRCRTSRPSAPAAVLATARVSTAGWSVTASAATIAVASCRASDSARSCAIWRASKASGTRKAMATIEVTASVPLAKVALTPRSPA